jgi:hypothetical protein
MPAYPAKPWRSRILWPPPLRTDRRLGLPRRSFRAKAGIYVASCSFLNCTRTQNRFVHSVFQAIEHLPRPLGGEGRGEGDFGRRGAQVYRERELFKCKILFRFIERKPIPKISKPRQERRLLRTHSPVNTSACGDNEDQSRLRPRPSKQIPTAQEPA